MSALRLDLEWRTTLLTAVLLPVLVALGFWQLEREQEKLALSAMFAQRQQLAPVPLASLSVTDPASLAYLPVTVTGSLVRDRYLLLDNRIYQGKFGYEVVALFRLEPSGQPVLINRGWIAGDPARLELPEVTQPSASMTLTGHVYVAPGEPYLLAAQSLEEGWPKRVQALDMALLAPALVTTDGAELYPYPVRLDGDQPAALTVDWQVVNVSPAKHRGYAVQWFTMAAVLLIFFVLRSSNLWQVIRRKDEDV